MKTIRMAAWALVACASTAALAEGPLSYPDAEDQPPAASTSTLTRADVIAAYFKSLEPAEPAPPSTLTRSAVMAAYFSARDRGELALHDEDSGSFWLAASGWRLEGATRLAQFRLLAARD